MNSRFVLVDSPKSMPIRKDGSWMVATFSKNIPVLTILSVTLCMTFATFSFIFVALYQNFKRIYPSLLAEPWAFFCATPLRFIPLLLWFVIIILNIPSIGQGTRETSRRPLPLFPGLIASRKTLPDAHSHTLAHIQMSARARFHRSAGVGLRLRELLAGFDHGFPQRAGSTSRRQHPASAKADPERMCA